MDHARLIDVLILAAIPILMARLFVGLSHPKRTNLHWTFALPTAALLFYVVRISLLRNVGLIEPDDSLALASWLALVASQLIATIYQWMPGIVVDRWRRRHPRDDGVH